MEIKLNIDEGALTNVLDHQLKVMAQGAIQREAAAFFEKKSVYNSNQQLVNRVGPGAKAIDDKVLEMFTNPVLTQRMDAYFEKHWERFFNNCMEKALMRKAHDVVRGRVNALYAGQIDRGVVTGKDVGALPSVLPVISSGNEQGFAISHKPT